MKKQTIITLVLAIFITSFAQAKVVYVNKNAPGSSHDGASWTTAFLTVQAAVDNTVSGDDLWIAAGSYAENILITKGLSLTGGFAGTETDKGQRNWKVNVTILDGNKAGRVINLNLSADMIVMIDGFTIQNGKDGEGGAVRVSSGQVTFSNDIITKNTVDGRGGGICVWSGNLAVTDCIISDNTAGWGGGFFGSDGHVSLTDNVISHNLATSGGGGVYYDVGTATISGNTITDNQADSGGGIQVSSGDVMVVNNTISGNNVVSRGGGVCFWNNSITLNSNTIQHNTAEWGGGFFGSRGDVALTSNTFSGNVARAGGGGIYYDVGTVNISGNTILDNRADTGGGIRLSTCNATIFNTTVSNNHSSGAGGGIYMEKDKVTISNCVVHQNAGGLACGIWMNETEAQIINSTIDSNSNDGVHGEFSTIKVLNCTICGNGAGLSAYNSAVIITNCIAAFNETGIAKYGEYADVTLSHNDVFGNTSANYLNINDPTGINGNISVNPLLSNPHHDIHIQSGSPCRDAGNDALVQPGWTDIDGQPRIQGAHVDIGSDESDGTPWIVPVRIWHVKPTGNDSNDGLSWDTAKKTVSATLSAARGLDEVWVKYGIYEEIVKIPSGVALYGGFRGIETQRSQRLLDPTSTVLEGDNQDVVTCLQASVLDGFSIRKGYHGVYVAGGTATVSNCLISQNSGYGVYVFYGSAEISNCTTSSNGAGVQVYSAQATLSNCAVDWNSLAGVYVDSSTAFVSNCVLRGNSSQGVYLSNGTATVTNSIISGGYYGIYVSPGTAIVTNCSVSGNGTGIYWTGGMPTITNCIVAFNEMGIQRTSPSPVMTLSHNDVYGNDRGDYINIIDPTGTNGNINADPLFVNHTSGDFHLNSYSPCIDAGYDSVVSPGTVDLDGKPRIQGAHVDMGAYEFPGGRPPYMLPEAVSALKVCAGLLSVSAGNRPRLDLNSDGQVTISDAARIARKVAGLEANP